MEFFKFFRENYWNLQTPTQRVKTIFLAVCAIALTLSILVPVISVLFSEPAMFFLVLGVVVICYGSVGYCKFIEVRSEYKSRQKYKRR